MKLKMAMIGGGIGSFIGPVHLKAARMDNMIELVAGAFSSNHDTSLRSGIEYGLGKERIYDDWQLMLKMEASRPDENRPDFICIATPNHLHFKPAMDAIAAGFHVVCDKPLCLTVEEAIKLRDALRASKKLFCLTHNYSAYPMIKKAREMVQDGELGTIRKVVVEYLQGWLSDREEEKGNKQAEWRADPAKAGNAGCMGDIGTHAFQLSEYITGKKVEKLYSQLNTFVEGRLLEDDGNVILNFEDGIKGSLIASQVALGEENAFSIRIYGTKGSLGWKQMEPNSLVVRWKDRPMQIYRTGTGFEAMGHIAGIHTRLPAGHPEGFIEAFANLYRNFAMHLQSYKKGEKHNPDYDYPGIEDGVRGMQFLEAVVRSSRDEKWFKLPSKGYFPGDSSC
ncbi:MAG: Gfo/Idh/MocA family oxidoreductase [Bacteroidales bacterium]|nr:Gfo/Idh/MocA family oxidoreductase [Bacteroidales bacterium]